MKAFFLSLALFIVWGTMALGSHYSLAPRENMADESLIEFTDTLKTLKDQSGEPIKVTFLKHAGIYLLNRKSPNFENLLNKLRKHHESGIPITLKVKSSSLEIMEVLSHS